MSIRFPFGSHVSLAALATSGALLATGLTTQPALAQEAEHDADHANGQRDECH